MKCLCCGKPIFENSTEEELNNRWHSKCVKKFFGTKKLPEIDFSEKALEQLAIENTSNGYTVPGVQKKLSLHLSKERGESPSLTLVNYPSGYILKPQTKDYPSMPESEYLIMQMAKETNIHTVPFALLKSGQNSELAYITKRIDRKDNLMLAMEDFCQLENRLTADKYIGSYERCAKIIDRYSINPGLDKTELFIRIVFSYAVGNSDMHLKNFSLIESEKLDGSYTLSDAYDLLPVNVIIPSDPDELALTLNGKNRNLRRKDFIIFAQNIGIEQKPAERMISKIVSLKQQYIQMCSDSYLPQDMKEKLSNLISKRIEKLEK